MRFAGSIAGLFLLICLAHAAPKQDVSQLEDLERMVDDAIDNTDWSDVEMKRKRAFVYGDDEKEKAHQFLKEKRIFGGSLPNLAELANEQKKTAARTAETAHESLEKTRETVVKKAKAKPKAVQPVAGKISMAGKTAHQSSNWDNDRVASKAIDGNSDGNWYHGSCSTTAKQNNPAWWVDLGQLYRIQSVLVHNRENCCTEELSGFIVMILNSKTENHVQCGVGPSMAGKGYYHMKCPDNAVGNTVKIYLPRDADLTICEVELFGVPQQALSLIGKPTYLSSTYSPLYPGSLAIDGNTGNGRWESKSCTHTKNQLNPYWGVNLGKTYRIYSVKVYNRMDCCSDALSGFQIIVNDSNEKLVVESPQQPSMNGVADWTVTCPPTAVGQYVEVYLHKQSDLMICEVEIVAEPV